MVSTTWRCMVQVGMPHLLVLNTGVCTCMLTQPNFSTNKNIYACSRFFHVFLKFFKFFFGAPGRGLYIYHVLKLKIMTTNEYIIKATLIAYKQGSISLDDAVEVIVDELNLATVK